jgi:hypothetical protein
MGVEEVSSDRGPRIQGPNPCARPGAAIGAWNAAVSWSIQGDEAFRVSIQ